LFLHSIPIEAGSLFRFKRHFSGSEIVRNPLFSGERRAGVEPLTRAARRWFSRHFAYRSGIPFKRLATTQRIDKFR
jgi:hypothetical protein